MKRRVDMFRDILLEIEALAPHTTLRFIDGTPEQGRDLFDMGFIIYEEEDIKFCDPERFYHARLLWEEGYACEPDIIAMNRRDDEIIEDLSLYRLTMDGHDFLDCIRDDNVWSKTKARLVQVGGSSSLEVMKALATSFAKTAVMEGL